MNTKHTPGPWWPSKNTAGTWNVLTLRDAEDEGDLGSAYGASICSGVGDHTEARTSGNEEANARLIAAAPDLLEALLEVRKCGNGGARLSRSASDKARAAIAKATGEQA